MPLLSDISCHHLEFLFYYHNFISPSVLIQDVFHDLYDLHAAQSFLRIIFKHLLQYFHVFRRYFILLEETQRHFSFFLLISLLVVLFLA
jgi:hypothetical protein